MPELLSGYQFLEISQTALLRERMLVRLREWGLKGTVLIAPEGINFSLGGESEALDAWLVWLGEHADMKAPVLNRQAVDPVPFLRLKVRIRPEIITFDPALVPGQAPTGQALSPQQWHDLLADDQVQLVDTRNHYEYELGSFDGAMDPAIESFTEFGDWALKNLTPDKPVAMFCTGGVRCEKASAWLLAQGYGQVYQLDGGILNYLRSIPGEQSRWHGECFVFDDRVSVNHALEPTGRPVCAGCRHPADGLETDGMPPVDESGQCRLCSERFDADRLAGLRERVRQIALARSRGQNHLGPKLT